MKYLRILFILLTAVFSTGHSDAQLRYGFRFGGDFAKATLKTPETRSGVENAPHLDNRSGFSGGLMLEYQFPKCGFAPDIALLYTRYNTRLVRPGSEPASFGRNFIEIPIHLKWKFWIPQTKNLFAPMIYTGPSFMFRLDHNKTHVVQPGWDLGIGFDIINFIQITAGYRFGLGNAIPNEADNFCLHTNGWNVSANILFDF